MDTDSVTDEKAARKGNILWSAESVIQTGKHRKHMRHNDRQLWKNHVKYKMYISHFVIYTFYSVPGMP